MCDELITDEEFEQEKHTYDHFVPPNKEALYFMRLFCEIFDRELINTIPHYWLPNFCGDVKEPSARVLSDIYDA